MVPLATIILYVVDPGLPTCLRSAQADKQALSITGRRLRLAGRARGVMVSQRVRVGSHALYRYVLAHHLVYFNDGGAQVGAHVALEIAHHRDAGVILDIVQLVPLGVHEHLDRTVR